MIADHREVGAASAVVSSVRVSPLPLACCRVSVASIETVIGRLRGRQVGAARAVAGRVRDNRMLEPS